MVSIFVFQREIEIEIERDRDRDRDRDRERELFSNVSFNITEKLHNLKIMSAVRARLL